MNIKDKTKYMEAYDSNFCNVDSQVKKLYYDRQSVGQFVLASGTHLRPATNFSHSLIIFWGSFGFVDVG
jgi:hypothetical protein